MTPRAFRLAAVVAALTVAAPLVHLEAAHAAAPTVTPTVVATRLTSVWTPPSPDPSGIVYLPGSDRLLVSDGEVEEMPLYAGANLYTMTRQGALTGTGTTVPWSNEPTGVAFNPATGMGFFTDDDKKSMFTVAGAGADGRFGTADDGARTSFKTPPFGHTDGEDAAFDTKRGEMLFVDGVNMKWFRLNPGPDAIFNGVAPDGDDIATEYDLAILGALDPEGIAYDSVRDTVLVVDGSADTIFELDGTNGSLMTKMNFLAANIQKAAGIAVAPASNGSGRRNYYVVDRGLDNNSHPEENDGRVLELSVTLSSINNRPPVVNAGPDQMIDLSQTANLAATATDDGLPNSWNSDFTFRWTKMSGPGTATFGNSQSRNTTVRFSLPGKYVLRFKADDSRLDDIDDMVVDVFANGGPRTVQIPIASSSDDAIQGGGANGNFVDTGSADVELGHNGVGAPPPQMIAGLRFINIPAPQGSEILSAKIQFRVDEVGTEEASYTIRGEASDNASTYVGVAGNISARPSTTATVPWSPPAWNLIGEVGPSQQTPDLKSIVQEIVNRPGWVNTRAIAFMIDGTGRRTAEAKDGLGGAVLTLEYRRGPNRAPYVNAGPDFQYELPAAAPALDGTVIDDGQPNTAPTQAWSKVSGPGTVTFGTPTSPDTTVTLSAPGTYVLRLTGNDGALSAFDEVTVRQFAAGAGPRTISIPIAAGSDDAFEGGGATGKFVDLASLDIELGNNGAATPVNVLTGLRFAGVGVPQGSEIVSAKIQFQVDEVGTSAADFTVRGEASGNPPTFVGGGAGDISARPTTVASVPWSPPAWLTINERGPDQLTAELKTIAQEIVNQRTWVSGNAMVFTMNGTGRRTAESFESLAPAALVLTYQRGPNTAPVVNAGLDGAVQNPTPFALDGTVNDDGQPNATPTVTWSKVSGPGTVTFGNAAAVDTTATFSAGGSYTLRLTANDGALSDFDEVVVAVEQANAAPTVDAGPNQAIQLPATAALAGVFVDQGYSNKIPAPDPATTAWSKVSGPGSVTFGDATALSTTAAFSTHGTYVLRLTSSYDGMTKSDDVSIAVEQANRAPVVSAGPDRSGGTLFGVNLDGTLIDPGYPAATVRWSKVSGPSGGSFSNITSTDTRFTGSSGTYILRLTATNNHSVVFDEVQVVISGLLQ